MHIPHVAIPLALTALTRTLTTLTSVPTQPVTLASQTTLDQFADNHCGQYITTFFVPSGGACHQIDGTNSNRLTNVQDGCTGKHTVPLRSFHLFFPLTNGLPW